MNEWIREEWQKLGGLALVTLPFALLFRALVAVRRALYRMKVLPSWRAPVPVIVVGIVLGALSRSNSGRNFCLVVFAIAVVRLMIGGGIV